MDSLQNSIVYLPCLQPLCWKTTFHSRSIINYGLIAPWIFIGSSSIVIGVCLVIVRKRKQFAVESKGVSEKSAAKQREIRHTVFMDKKGVDAFPGYRSKHTMIPKDQVWLLFLLLILLACISSPLVTKKSTPSSPSGLFAFDSSWDIAILMKST